MVNLNYSLLVCSIQISLNIVAVSKKTYNAITGTHLFCNNSVCILVRNSAILYK